MIKERNLIIVGKFVWELDVKYAGETRISKIAKIIQAMARKNATHHIISDPEDIAWTLNLRGNDEEYCPVFLAYLSVDKEQVTLFAKRKDFSAKLIATLLADKIIFRDYEEIDDYAKELRQGSKDNSSIKVLLDTTKTSEALLTMLGTDVVIIDEDNPATLLKAIKNEIEIANMRQAYIKDGVAVTKLLYWLCENVGHQAITEFRVADKIVELRQQNEDYLGESFPPIVGYQEHGVIIHYSATDKTNASIRSEGMLLIDIGGHYLCGTTDTTRTISLSQPTAQQKKHYTAILKGNINLAMRKFSQRTFGIELDAIARRPIQALGLDYKHGTGHGVGYLLNVHEGPQVITTKGKGASEVAFKAGMIMSNEPGVYLPGEYGIRLENVMLCKEAKDQLLEFETLTQVPFDISLIDAGELTKAEKQYLNKYHEEVYQTLLPYLSQEEGKWLATITAKV